ncbi:YesK family protein [Oceanobacillus sp. J11TS1]|uniref:YesK family protein n=1 Tax=Oceanobacillus sp. J11TS1 TaxID=2807191 RepID=UPI001B1FDF51|nr:YesK family protein [Oceanobacillus sp. J11TS1]GIO23074.1 hypothetical protein J11TS1_16550 [Oceanobacillus sp. J11TS1]
MKIIMEFLPFILGMSVILLLISLFVKEKRVIPPMVVSSISIICVFISLFFDGWKGMGFGFISLAAFISSIIILLIMIGITWHKGDFSK